MADSVLFQETKHYCAGCGIEFIPIHSHIPDLDTYCAMCVYGPFLHVQELATQVEKYAGAIRNELNIEPINEVRIAKLGKALHNYGDRLQVDLAALTEAIVIMRRMKDE